MINLIQVMDAAEFCEATKEIWSVIGTIITIIQYAVPVLIVLLGTIDLGKAVMAGKDDEIKSAQKMLIKRLIYGVVVFFVVVIVKAIFTGIGHSEATTNRCFYYLGFK